MADEHQDESGQATANEGEVDSSKSAADASRAVAEPSPSTDVEPQRTSTEVIDIEPDLVRPLPPSLRVKSALDATSPPMTVMSTLPSANWPPTVVADLMTRKIITVREHEPVENLEECMQRFKFRHLPVVDSEMKLVGLISRTDLLHAELGRKPDGTDAPRFDAQVQAGSIMRKNVVVARPDYPLQTACRVMLEKKLTCLPVVLEDGKLAGILTDTDFVKLSLLLLESRAK